MDDASIIELFNKRDQQAIAELKKKYHRLCQYTAGRILSQPEDAEECISSAYFDIWNKIPPEVPADLKTYLCRIVRNKAIDRLKYDTAAVRDKSLTVSLDELAECIPAADPEPSAAELAEALTRFLRGQDELHRKIFVRRYWYGDTLAQIGELYSVKERTVATYLFRTRKKLKAFLRKEGYDNG
ncbi:MAG: RNA polymerase sigma factor [Ruminococcus sp.]|nr:RNA polymerase sigma factor [Ruminococcus sp.]